ncbi:MAG TPA: hydroxymethylpyrimidine/phosphomethylpyrimidine kinase, partial [Steroidobacteraceae bacterium]|nr:hydroxymethylpyrimidine/phosphomethylpyrimidine kinase [Steroidobacteraceae bacterium]
RDLATLALLRANALCAVTAITVQSEARVIEVHPLSAELVAAQIEASLARGAPGAIKIGMLANAAIVRAVAAALPAHVPVVLDPVLAASSGGELLDAAGRAALPQLLPRVALLTPNIPEAARLLGTAPAEDEATLVEQARALLALGPAAVLLKGGHAYGPEAVDLLVTRGAHVQRLSAPRRAGTRRGTGCALSSAIAAYLARGTPLSESCARGKAHVDSLFVAG